MLRKRRDSTATPGTTLTRFAVGALLLVAIPAYAQAVASHGDATEKAMRCVHAVMTDALLPVGVMPEQLAKAALARCFDEIEAAVASSDLSAAKANSARTTLRKELYDYALQLSGIARSYTSYAGEALVDAFAGPGSWLPNEAKETQPERAAFRAPSI